MTLGQIVRTLLLGFPVGREFIVPGFPAALQRIGGLALSVVLTLLSLALGLPLGALLAAARMRGAARQPAWFARAIGRGAATAVIEVIRGLPTIVLVLLVFYLPYPLFGWRVPGVVLALAALALFSSANAADMFRAGFSALDAGVVEAARVLGLSPWQVFLRLRLPVAIRTMLPALLGLAITVFKDSSVLTVVAVPDLSFTARQLLVAAPRQYLMILSFVILFYWSGASSAAALVRRLDLALSAGTTKQDRAGRYV